MRYFKKYPETSSSVAPSGRVDKCFLTRASVRSDEEREDQWLASLIMKLKSGDRNTSKNVKGGGRP